jgi:hypothetical protein
MRNRVPRPASCRDRDAAPQRRDILLDDVHPDTASRHVGHGLGGGEAGTEDQGEHVVVAQGLLGPDEPLAARLGEDALATQATPVVADIDVHVAAPLGRLQPKAPHLGLADRAALVALLEPVVDGVADEMEEWIADLLDDRLVELGLLAG